MSEEVQNAMTTEHKRRRRSRWAGVGLGAALLMVLTGDGVGQAGITGGIDPLDVLDLQVKPNVIVVLDSSGSMQENLYRDAGGGAVNLTVGDWRESKMGLAKSVLKQVITGNSTKANFLLGQYTVDANSIMTRRGLNDGTGRFRYLTNVDWNDLDDDTVFDAGETTLSGSQSMRTACPSATTTTACELFMTGRGFQAWQWIDAAWGTLYFQEGGVNCAATITPGFYRTQADLITEMRTRMNACAGRPGTPNVYTITAQSNGRFRFSAPTNTFTLQWQTGTPNNIAGALAAYSGTTGNPPQPTYANATVTVGTTYTTLDSLRLLWRGAGDEDEEVNFDPDGSGPLTTRDRTTYFFRANKAWNGELFYVDGAGATCGFDATSPVKTDPPSFRVQQVSNCLSPTASTVGSVVTFEWGGGVYGGNGVSCNGFQVNVKLPPCDAPPPSNIDVITSNLELQFGINHDTASAGFGTILGYAERTDGTHQMQSLPAAAGIHADGSTPIANSLIDIRPVFSALWFTGQADDPVTPLCTSPGVPFGCMDETRTAIRTQTSPRERTIILFVTDGDDTCPDGGSGSDDNAKRAAHKAEQLFAELEAGFPESSVTTYSIGFGSGASTNRLNWIGWGGSGMGQGLTGQPNVATTGTGTQQRWSETAAQLTAKRALCTTCIDAFIAPDAATLAAQLQAILDQGATLGEFTAQQSVFTSILELVADAGGDPDDPTNRYNVFVPNLIRASFTMPGFKGQVRALQNKGTIVENWNAGQKLFDRVNAALLSCNDSGIGGECNFASLLARIDRRIYTSPSNGVFPATVSELTTESWLTTDGNRAILWPATSAVAPQNDSAFGTFDGELTLPLANDLAAFNTLSSTYGACAGAPLAPTCAGTDAVKAARARREARERILAYMAGAQAVLDTTTGLPKRLANGNMVFVRRDWILADSTLAIPGILGQPIQPEPTGSGFEAEYRLLRDSVGGSQSLNDAAARLGFGLRNDGGSGAVVANSAAPSMTVSFIPANDMLHAFRAGPSCGVPPYSTCAELGGIELWGYVPYDQIGKLTARLLTNQTRANHTYMVAASVRFADVFVPNPGTADDPGASTTTLTVAGTSQTVKGVWRRLLFFGRGIAGKFLTALDVTTAGDYKTVFANSIPPAVLWSRGNPDTDPEDAPGYAKMGQTWSVPTVAFVDRAANTTDRKPAGVDFVLYVGSGYGDTSGCGTGGVCEGQAFFTLDALTGDVVAAADIPASSGTPTGGYANSLVANAVSFNPGEFQAAALGSTGHPASSKVERAYIGDLHGRVWKFLSSDPGTPLLVTDLGIEQPIAAAVAVLGFDESGTTVPHVYVNSGYDRRQDPAKSGEPFVLAGIRDDLTTALTPDDACQQTPVVAPCLFVTELTQVVGSDTGYFRGTIQPTTTIGISGGVSVGRVFFAGTRFNPPAPEGAPFAPTPPPCKSSFDSILYALGAKTGEAAFELNADPAADQSYVIFDNSKIAGIGIIAAPDGSGGTSTQLTVDEGLMSQTGGGGAGGNCVGGEGPDCIPPGGPTPGGAGGGGGVTTTSFRPSSTICN